MLQYFQTFRDSYYAAVYNKRTPPSFKPPKPKREDALLALLKVLRERLSVAKFQESLRQCFVRVGICPDEHGYMKFAGAGIMSSRLCF